MDYGNGTNLGNYSECGDCRSNEREIERLEKKLTAERKLSDRLAEALGVAHGHIVNHHNVSKPQKVGQFCPRCVHEDGTEPELDMIAKARADYNTARGNNPPIAGSNRG